MRYSKPPSWLKYILRLSLWGDDELDYGFYLRRSFFSWGEDLDSKGQGLQLRFAWRNRDWKVMYL